MKNNLLSKKSFGLIASLLAAISLLAVAATPVFAKPLSPLPVSMIKLPAGNNTPSYNDSLSALFSHEKTMFNSLHPGADIRMTAVNEAAEVLADTEKFDSSVANFDTQQHRELVEKSLAQQVNTVRMEDARISELVRQARSLIAAHPGFAENGDVTNAAVALRTINTINAYVANIQYFVNRSNTDLTNAEQAKRVLAGSLRAISLK